MPDIDECPCGSISIEILYIAIVDNVRFIIAVLFIMQHKTKGVGKTVYVEMVNTSCPLLLNANHNHHTQKGMSTAESVIPNDRCALNVLYM